jgi:hypothetical protein
MRFFGYGSGGLITLSCAFISNMYGRIFDLALFFDYESVGIL